MTLRLLLEFAALVWVAFWTLCQDHFWKTKNSTFFLLLFFQGLAATACLVSYCLAAAPIQAALRTANHAAKRRSAKATGAAISSPAADAACWPATTLPPSSAANAGLAHESTLLTVSSSQYCLDAFLPPTGQSWLHCR